MNVLIPYSTREVTADTSYSVPRLVYFLCRELQQNGINVFCYSFSGSVLPLQSGIEYVSLPLVHKAITKFDKKHKKLYFNEYVHKRSKDKNIDFVICCTFDSFEYFMGRYPDEKIIYWAHNYPPRSAIDQFLGYASRRKFILTTPSRNLYTRLWNELNPDTLSFFYKHIPNTALPASVSSSIAKISDRYNFEFKSRINFIHISGGQLNKGLHIIKKIFSMLPGDLPINFIYTGKEFTVERRGNVCIIEMPRMPYSELIELYRIADFGVMSSIWFETAPLALHEMLDNKVIPIITRSGGMEEIIADSKCFLISRPNDIDEWNDTISKCCLLDEHEISKIKESNHAIYNASKLNTGQWGKIWTDFLNAIK